MLLPIIIVGQSVQAAATDTRALADHETLTAIHTLTAEVHTINEQQNVPGPARAADSALAATDRHLSAEPG